ncbi:MAG: hypothetical protein AAGI30_07700 [Planctomycetota bacterium]
MNTHVLAMVIATGAMSSTAMASFTVTDGEQRVSGLGATSATAVPRPAGQPSTGNFVFDAVTDSATGPNGATLSITDAQPGRTPEIRANADLTSSITDTGIVVNGTVEATTEEFDAGFSTFDGALYAEVYTEFDFTVSSTTLFNLDVNASSLLDFNLPVGNRDIEVFVIEQGALTPEQGGSAFAIYSTSFSVFETGEFTLDAGSYTIVANVFVGGPTIQEAFFEYSDLTAGSTSLNLDVALTVVPAPGVSIAALAGLATITPRRRRN